MAWQRAYDLASKITSFASERLKGEHIRLQSIETMVPALADSQLKNARMKLHAISSLLPAAANDAISKARIRIEGITTTLRMASHTRIQIEYPQLIGISNTLKTAAPSLLEKERTRLDNLEKLTDVLNPASTLKRGYSITKICGKAVSNADMAKPGDILETITANGSILSTVDQTPKKYKK